MISKRNLWISTSPRCASYWVYNVAKELIKLNNLDIFPKEDFIDYDEERKKTFEFFKKNLNNNDEKKFFLFKIHRILSSRLPNSKIITVIRDPREIIVSNMRFSKSEFKPNFETAKYFKKMTEIYSNYDKEILLSLRYEDISNNNIKVIKKIADFINLDVSNENLIKISDKFSKENNKKSIKENDEKIIKKIKAKSPIERHNIIHVSKDFYRFYNLKTGFQSGHISNMSRDNYREYLSKEQIKDIQEYFKDWFKQYNYPFNY